MPARSIDSANTTAFRELQANLGLSKSQVAALIGIHLDTVAKWRSGKRPVPAYALTILKHETERRARQEQAPAEPCAEYRPHPDLAGLDGTPFCRCGFERRQH